MNNVREQKAMTKTLNDVTNEVEKMILKINARIKFLQKLK